MIDSNVTISIIGFVTTIVVTVLNQRSTAREAKRQSECKAEELQLQLQLAAKLADMKAEKLFVAQSIERDKQFRDQSAELTDKITVTTDSIISDLKKNTDISIQAFKEANNVNNKISHMQNVLLKATIGEKKETTK